MGYLSWLSFVVEALEDKKIEFRLWFSDETRLGLHPRKKKVLTARGVKPVKIQGPVYKSTWLYGAVEPKTGEHFMMFWSHLDSACFEKFLEEFSKENEGFHVLVMDNASAHKAEKINWPENILPVCLPPYSPELNPVERLWQALKAQLASWYKTMEELIDDVEWFLDVLDDDMVHSLCFYPYIQDILLHH